MFQSLYLARPWSSCFEGEDDAAAKAAAKAAAEKAAIGGDGDVRSPEGFTDEQQKKFNEVLAAERRKQEAKHQAALKEQAEKLEGVLRSASLTEADRKALKENLESVQGQLRSAEASAAKEKQELEHSYNVRLTETEKKATVWEQLYRDSSVQRALQDAAVKNDAWQPVQIVTILKPMTKLVEELDPVTRKPNGQYKVEVTMMEVNPKTNELEPMVRSPEDSVKRMKELPDQYGNLFKSGVVSGIGSGSATGGVAPGQGGKIDVRKLTPAQYREIRANHPEWLGLAPKRR
jgi:hypothetical protein